MNYQKMDAALLAAITRTEVDLIQQITELENVFVTIEGKRHTAKLTISTIKELSDQSWVQRISLGRGARLYV